ncbi:hypothetical protein SAMN05421773_1157 [Streptomyces aidingensis]|uniref:DUF3631 domain-containing protein n=1 Tax=Streptomyces aidingensis TaxID=910347 RepID=A0A1I1S7K8_9ACTN|nr:hypothetical protein SAMN05421773_1157 [Streptomyces aidingensis]
MSTSFAQPDNSELHADRLIAYVEEAVAREAATVRDCPDDGSGHTILNTATFKLATLGAAVSQLDPGLLPADRVRHVMIDAISRWSYTRDGTEADQHDAIDNAINDGWAQPRDLNALITTVTADHAAEVTPTSSAPPPSLRESTTTELNREAAGVQDAPELTPAAPVDGAALLDEVEAFHRRFNAFPSEHAYVAVTLWDAHTRLLDCFDSAPRLAFLSPEPGSGKTRALEVIESLVPTPMRTENCTPAALFRAVSDLDSRPTLLFDEIDAVFGPKAQDDEELRGLINAGRTTPRSPPRHE